MKKHDWILFAAVLVLGLFAVTANAQASDAEDSKVHLSGLIEFGGVSQSVDKTVGQDEDESDLALTTMELTAEAEVNERVDVAATLLYEDATFEDETSADLDVAILTIRDIEGLPLNFSAGVMYVPFGALLTHFPDDPLVDDPLTLVLGETREKAVLFEVEHQGFSASAYAFNGDVDKAGEDNAVESYGVDVNYTLGEGAGAEILVGASYISNIADSDGNTEAIPHMLSVEVPSFDPDADAWDPTDYVAGAAAYLHVGFGGFFVDGEYMTALDELEIEGTAGGAPFAIDTDSQPAVWNLEVGCNLDWGRNLEIALKYAGSDESEGLGFPETRYGLCLNQELFEGVIGSVAYLHDDYEDNDVNNNDERDVVYAQIAIEF